jgi:hypothetical protein
MTSHEVRVWKYAYAARARFTKRELHLDRFEPYVKCVRKRIVYPLEFGANPKGALVLFMFSWTILAAEQSLTDSSLWDLIAAALLR